MCLLQVGRLVQCHITTPFHVHSARLSGVPLTALDRKGLTKPVSHRRSSSRCCVVCARHEYLFKFDNTFEIHDDIEVLKRMGLSLGLEMGRCSQENLAKALKLVPKALQPYVLGEAMLMLTSPVICV